MSKIPIYHLIFYNDFTLWRLLESVTGLWEACLRKTTKHSMCDSNWSSLGYIFIPVNSLLCSNDALQGKWQIWGIDSYYLAVLWAQRPCSQFLTDFIVSSLVVLPSRLPSFPSLLPSVSFWDCCDISPVASELTMMSWGVLITNRGTVALQFEINWEGICWSENYLGTEVWLFPFKSHMYLFLM